MPVVHGLSPQYVSIWLEDLSLQASPTLHCLTLSMTPCLPIASRADLRAQLVNRPEWCSPCLQPTQWHTSAEAPEPAESADASRAGSDQGASTSGRQPVDFIFGFLPEARQQELAAGRGATGES